ncbi:hydrogen gas-evolving membrane-bound hydrogenase subunit E [Methanospirillum purgamenti]|jgi:multisubunit Na+/H+ antiporter MnhB subunit|nr:MULTISPECIES: hydrogen gas-evolving membrane-bound hydrogenase subunit E [Methanospirillum]MDX8549727.1 hydrogen gas-evolving membrane-bound hydrogenase subunit E [Methanospirillum hungatei]
MMRTKVAWFTLVVLAAGLLFAAVSLPFGSPAMSDMDDYFIAHGQEQTGANNIVTSIVFDFRAFDTLGEACVLFTAVFGVSVLFRLRKKEEDYEYE